MRILASGDHHFDEHGRFDECLRVHRWIADAVRERKPDAFVSAGDIYERASTPDERAAVADWLTSIAEVCPVVIAKGNHDRRRDCELLGRLESRYPIHVVEGCGVVRIGTTAIAVMAWPSKASLAAMIGRPLSGEALEAEARDCMRDVLRGFAGQWAGATHRVLLGHWMIDGSETSTGQPLVGAELRVGIEDLALAGAGIVVAGHIHKPQNWGDVVYTGSPFRTAFGETEEKSILEIRGNDAGEIVWERLQTPARAMLQIDMAWGGHLHGMPGVSAFSVTSRAYPHAHVVPEAEIRLRYSVAADQRDAARAAARAIRDGWLADGAHSVKLEEEVASSTRARAPEIATARTLPEKLDRLWASRGDAPPAERRASILAKLSELEEEPK